MSGPDSAVFDHQGLCFWGMREHPGVEVYAFANSPPALTVTSCPQSSHLRDELGLFELY